MSKDNRDPQTLGIAIVQKMAVERCGVLMAADLVLSGPEVLSPVISAPPVVPRGFLSEPSVAPENGPQAATEYPVNYMD